VNQFHKNINIFGIKGMKVAVLYSFEKKYVKINGNFFWIPEKIKLIL
jgi:ribonucleotide reductase beta subunit family protein with ferritin-like domain